jgi:hypothetical protein
MIPHLGVDIHHPDCARDGNTVVTVFDKVEASHFVNENGLPLLVFQSKQRVHPTLAQMLLERPEVLIEVRLTTERADDLIDPYLLNTFVAFVLQARRTALRKVFGGVLEPQESGEPCISNGANAKGIELIGSMVFDMSERGCTKHFILLFIDRFWFHYCNRLHDDKNKVAPLWLLSCG